MKIYDEHEILNKLKTASLKGAVMSLRTLTLHTDNEIFIIEIDDQQPILHLTLKLYIQNK